jgi:hypothetical protein
VSFYFAMARNLIVRLSSGMQRSTSVPISIQNPSVFDDDKKRRYVIAFSSLTQSDSFSIGNENNTRSLQQENTRNPMAPRSQGEAHHRRNLRRRGSARRERQSFKPSPNSSSQRITPTRTAIVIVRTRVDIISTASYLI